MDLPSPEEGGQLLYQAATYNNTDLLKDLLSGQYVHHLDWRDTRGRTALHVAAEAGHLSCLNLLLAAGAEVNVASSSTSDDSKTPLQLAAAAGFSTAVEALTQAGADIFAKDKKGYCALELAQMAGHQQTACSLIDTIGLELACSKGNLEECVEALKTTPKTVLNAVLNGASEDDYTLLYRASERGHTEVAKELIRYGADGRIHPVTLYSPLYIATYAGHKDVVHLLLQHFPELVQVETFEGWLPIHAACKTGDTRVLRELLTKKYPEFVLQYFFDPSGKRSYRFAFDLNRPDPECRTPLYIACQEGKLDAVRMLLEFRVDMTSDEEESGIKSTPPEPCYEDVPFRAAPEDSDGSAAGDTPVKKARSKLNTIRTSSPESPPEGRKLFPPVNVDVYSKMGRTPLQVAVAGNHVDIVRQLIELRGANVNLPLAITDEELAQLHPSEAEGLLCAGSGALMEACRTGNGEMVDLLLEFGATDHDNRALSCCVRGNHEKLACQLLCRQVFQDPEYRVNKKGVEVEAQFGRGQQLMPSTLYPSSPSMLNWHRAGLRVVQEDWILKAGLHLNPKIRQNPLVLPLIYSSITRIDVSRNSLETLPPLLFQLPSLRILNASHNALSTLPEIEYVSRRSRPNTTRWTAPVLEELHIQHNSLASLPSDLFTSLPSLYTLDASHNQLQELPSALWFSPKLKDFNVSFNRLASLPSWGSEQERPSSQVSDEADIENTEPITPLRSAQSVDEPSFSLGTEGPGGSRTSVEKCVDENLSVQELKRHNLWQKSVELSKYSEEEEESSPSMFSSRRARHRSNLSSMNLGHNQFRHVPECLSCVAPSVTRLNLSGNLLTEIGPPSNFPCKLKHLDLSGNRITNWFTRAKNPGDLACFWEMEGRDTQRSPKPHSPTPSRRSQSMARNHRSLSVASGRSEVSSPLSASVLPICSHKRHWRLDNLRTLILAGNRLERIELIMDSRSAGLHHSQRSRKSVNELESSFNSGESGRTRILFPCLSMLDVSGNSLITVPATISDISSLSVLNLSENPDITSLPPEMGLLNKLWNLNLTGCSLSDPLKSMLDSKKYKTMDIIGYLKSILEDSKPYARMKLMIVGIQGIGKTSLLEQLRQEGTVTARKNPPEGWARRMGNKNINQKTNKGVSISTVGVDVSDWTFEPKKGKNQPYMGPVTYRTWDFGGQREYYATHQYFLSKRSLYLVVWRVTDGEAGINEILQWLVNIQARAPNSPVIIVGTHFDEILANNKKFPPQFVDDLQQKIRERFVAIQDADKKGLPKVVESVVVSSKSRYNIHHLCQLIYMASFDQRACGSKERLLEQKVPASYLALEEVVCQIADERKGKKKDPVVTGDQYRTMVQSLMLEKFGKTFRDTAELNQATSFLHENGVMLHYDDATLKDLYFLDPQWLCDILAHVITIREINPFAKNGLMRLDDLKVLFKSSRFTPLNIRNYILNLLQKFEVAMTWDNRNLLIPCLLPDEYQVRGGYPDCEVIVPARSKGWTAPSAKQWKARYRSQSSTAVAFLAENDELEFVSTGPSKSPTISTVAENVATETETSRPLFTLKRPQSQSPKKKTPKITATWTPLQPSCMVRIYLMAYVPSGFWSRLIIRLLSEQQLTSVWEEYFDYLDTPDAEKSVEALKASNPFQWYLWQTGAEVKMGGQLMFSIKEFLPLAEIRDVNYSDVQWCCQIEGNWQPLKAETSSAVEIYLPLWKLGLDTAGDVAVTDVRAVAKIMAVTVELIDTLLEDWYPSLGTRFVHTSEGKLLVSRLVPCPQCFLRLSNTTTEETTQKDWTIIGIDSPPTPSTPLGEESGGGSRKMGSKNSLVGFTIEECILFAHNSTSPQCPIHGLLPINDLAVDVLFMDVKGKHLVMPDQVKRGKLLGRGAFGFVFKATVTDMVLPPGSPTSPSIQDPSSPEKEIWPKKYFRVVIDRFGGQNEKVRELGGSWTSLSSLSPGEETQHEMAPVMPIQRSKDVAMKLLQPVDPGFGARQSALTAYKAAWAKWQRDPLQYASRAYCTARQELNVLSHIKHPNIVPLVGVCPRPLALVVDLAPLGALNSLLQNYRRSGAKLRLPVLKECLAQTGRALEYLHQEHIIYRDLKSENVLVWQFPPPFSQLITAVEIKLGDYGISRSVFPSGGAKGFGGTEGFMAPEIMRYNGEEEYTEKVDCFSFAMFIYELISLKLPYEGQEQVKEFMLDGGRPQLTPSELLQPCNILDLMVVGWAPQPSDRPSASQIVSITTAPEFSHLIDVVSLSDPDSAVLCGEAFTMEESSVVEEQWSGGLEGELWLSRADGQVSLLSCNGDGWLDCKNIFVNEDSFVTAMTLVEDTIWLGELTGVLRVFCAKTYCELYSFALAPHVLPLSQSPKHQLSLPVAAIQSLATLRLVLVGTAQPGTLLLCRMTDNLGGEGNSDPVIATHRVSSRELHTFTSLPLAQGKVEVWTGQSGGFITIFSIEDQIITEHETVNHYDPHVEGVEVTRLVSSEYDGRYVWSYVFPGSVLYQWNTAQRAITAKLDCSKIAPCSESISTMNIEEKLNPGRCQVSAICLLEKYEGTQLYIGSTWGVVILAEADGLKPVTAFRTHMEDIRVIAALTPSKKASIYESRKFSASSATTTPSGKSGDYERKSSGSGKKWNDFFKGKSNKLDKGNGGKDHKTGADLNPSSPSGGDKYILTVGKGYRCLIQRFLDNYREDPAVLESRTKDYFAVLWGTEDWM